MIHSKKKKTEETIYFFGRHIRKKTELQESTKISRKSAVEVALVSMRFISFFAVSDFSQYGKVTLELRTLANITRQKFTR